MAHTFQNIFFSGIGGSGMSSMALFMAGRGHSVSGSDRAFDQTGRHPVYRALLNRGINLVPQDGSGITPLLDLTVFSTAVEPDNPEFLKARELGIPTKTRPDYLAGISTEFTTLAVSGTSGKSTTAGMLAFLMRRLSLDPNFIGGGRVKQFRDISPPGNVLNGGSDLLVIEACESDGTIVQYKPYHTILLNLAFDHHTIEKTAGLFRELLRNTKDRVVINADDTHLAEMLSDRHITFSITRPSSFMAGNITFSPFKTEFTLHNTRFRLSVPGRHNLYNALACISMLSLFGVQTSDIADILPEFTGLERRFDIHLNDGRMLVIDDYAHNPHKISSLMETVKGISDKICYIFQPHGFAPTLLMKNEYIATFSTHLRASDHLIVLPVFYAGGTASRDISSRDLVKGIRSSGRSAEAADSREDAMGSLSGFDTIVVTGARDESLSGLASDIAKASLARTGH